MKYFSRFVSIPNLIIIFILIAEFGTLTLDVYSQPQNEILAIVTGRNITKAEVELFSPSEHLALDQKQLYALRKVALDNFIIKILLEKEAKRRNISVASLRKEFTRGVIEIPDEAVEKEYLKNALYFASMSPDEVKERLRLDLESEARMQLYLKAISNLKAKAKIRILLKSPQSESQNFDNLESPSKGAKNAKITIIEFSDFHCRYCKESEKIIKKVLMEYGENIRFIYKHLPLQINKQGILPAIASHCANSQGYFWEFHDSLFNSDDLSSDFVKKIARDKGLDLSKFDSCLTSENSRFAVLNDLKEAKQLGITATPSFIINDRIYVGRLDFDEFKDIIERELFTGRKTN
ncbi:MAG: thioredoxin domain-containing protein [Pyrinomonadaceae bacterium]|nr:thioredoxin domain-containing protein [Pyrinomonadaceae bacterium]